MKDIAFKLLLISIYCFLSLSGNAQIFKWKDNFGIIHLTNRIPEVPNYEEVKLNTLFIKKYGRVDQQKTTNFLKNRLNTIKNTKKIIKDIYFPTKKIKQEKIKKLFKTKEEYLKAVEPLIVKLGQLNSELGSLLETYRTAKIEPLNFISNVKKTKSILDNVTYKLNQFPPPPRTCLEFNKTVQELINRAQKFFEPFTLKSDNALFNKEEIATYAHDLESKLILFNATFSKLQILKKQLKD